MNVNGKSQHTHQIEIIPYRQKLCRMENTVLIYSRKCFKDNILYRFSKISFEIRKAGINAEKSGVE